MWVARLRGGDFKQTARGPRQCQCSLLPLTPFSCPHLTRQTASLDHVTRSQQKKALASRSTSLSPTRPESAWAPLLFSLPSWALHPLMHGVGSGHVGPGLSTGSCRHRRLAGPAPSPPGRRLAFPQPGLLKSNSSFQLQHEKAPGPAFPRDPVACRSHGQGIFPVQRSKQAEPPEQRR